MASRAMARSSSRRAFTRSEPPFGGLASMPAARDGDLAFPAGLGRNALAFRAATRRRGHVDDAPLIGLTINVRIAGRIDERALRIADGVSAAPHRRWRAQLAAMSKPGKWTGVDWRDDGRL